MLTLFLYVVPALLTTESIRPNLSSQNLTRFSQSAFFVTSARTKSHLSSLAAF